MWWYRIAPQVVILLALFQCQNRWVSALDLPAFDCRDLDGKCEGEGVYACSVRNQVPKCGNGGEDAGYVERAVCRKECHFSPQCGSYAWNEADAQCTLCDLAVDQTLDVATWSVPLEGRSDGAVHVLYGVHHGSLARFSVMGYDYILSKYITPSEDGFRLKSILVSGRAEEVELTVQGNFCVFLPRVYNPEELSRKKSEWNILPWIVFAVVGALLWKHHGLRRALRFLRNRARTECL